MIFLEWVAAWKWVVSGVFMGGGGRDVEREGGEGFFWSTLSKDTSFCLAISIETKGFEVAEDRSVAGF